MKLKYYLRGIGIGIILTAIVMGFALGGRKATMSDAEIIERAKALGMTEGGVLTSVSSEENSANDTEDYSSSADGMDEASEEISEEIDEELIASGETSQELVSETEEAGSEASEGKSDAEEISKSEDITQDAQNSTEGSESEENTTEQTDVKETTAKESDVKESKTEDTTSNSSTGNTSSDQVSDNTASGTSKTVTIPGGNSSDSVSQILYNAGVIDDPYSFNRYLIDRGLDRVIRSGTKTFPAGATYEDVAGIITR